MNISAKTEYACIAVMELAIQYESQEPVRIRKIAEEYGIPSRFLVQILLQLKGAGIVSSTRGASGGYQLVRSPDSITLAEVMGVIEGKNQEISSNAQLETAVSRTLLDVWNIAAKQQDQILRSITFGELTQRLQRETDNMYYI